MNAIVEVWEAYPTNKVTIVEIYNDDIGVWNKSLYTQLFRQWNLFPLQKKNIE